MNTSERSVHHDEKILAAEIIQHQAALKLKDTFHNFETVYENVWWPFLTGIKPQSMPFETVVSPLLYKTGDFVASVEFYRSALKVSHNIGKVVPLDSTFGSWKAFFVCLKHCTDVEEWRHSDRLLRLLSELRAIVRDNANRLSDHSIFCMRIDSLFASMTELVSDTLCSAVVARENGINAGTARELPCCDEYGGPFASGGELMKQIVSDVRDIHKWTMPASFEREDIYDLVNAIKNDKSLFPHGGSIKDAVHYIKSAAHPLECYRIRIERARDAAMRLKKKRADGEEMFWRSIAGEARPSRRNLRSRKRRDDKAPPGECANPQGWR